MASSQSSSGKKVTNGKRNLMSVIESLHPVSFLDPPGAGGPSELFPSESPQLTSGFKQDKVADISTQDATVGCGELEISEREDGTVITDVLRLLYEVSSSNTIETVAQDPLVNPPEHDDTLLQMQHPPEGSIAGIQYLFRSYANGTPEVRSILDNDMNCIYECKRCQSMFRSLPNLIQHKKEDCKNIGLLPSFMNRPSNSTGEEDAAFQMVLDVLHPREPSLNNMDFIQNPNHPPQSQMSNSIDGPNTVVKNLQPLLPKPRESSLNMDFILIPNQPPQSQTSNSIDGPKTVVKNLQPILPKPVKVKSSRMLTSHTQTISNNNAKQVISSPGITASSSDGKNLKIFVAGTFQPPAFNLSLSRASQKKTYSCPICGKLLSSRTSARRHLIDIHMMCQIDSLNMTQTPIAAKPGSNMHKCVESIKLGPNRIIHVLPENFALSATRCPICDQEICRKINVRRHILEAHKLVIKNDQKYFQLKKIAAKNMSGTRRGLRHLFTANSSKSLPSQVNRPPPATLNSETSSRLKPILPVVSTESQMKESRHLAIHNVTFVPSIPPASTKSQIAPTTLRSSTMTPLSTDTKPVDETKDGGTEVTFINESTVNKIEDGTLVQEETDCPGSSSASSNKAKKDVLQTLDYECSPCNKTFSRRRTFENHMSSFHNLSGDVHSCTSSDGCSDSDKEPPSKLRKLSAIVAPKETKKQASVLYESLPRAEISTDVLTKTNDESAAVPDVNEASGASTASPQKSVTLDASSTTLQSIISLRRKNATVSTSQTPVRAMVTSRNPERLNATTLRSSKNGKNHQLFHFSKGRALLALKTFPKEYVNPMALRCMKCRHRYQKTWDLKMHLLKHLEISLFGCRYCKKLTEENTTMIRSSDLLKHLAESHNVRVTAENRHFYFSHFRVNLKNLWEAYGLPAEK